MSYQANIKIEEIRQLIRNCYGAIAEKGSKVPNAGDRTLSNLPSTIEEMNAGGAAKSLEKYFGMMETLGFSPISDEDITNELESMFANTVAVEPHESELIVSVKTNKGDTALEQFYPIPDEIEYYSMSSEDIINELQTTWQLFEL